MIEVGRRSFLFGLGAVVAAAAIKAPAAIIVPTPPTLVLPQGLRLYREVTVSLAPSEDMTPIIWDIYEGAALRTPSLHFVLHPQGNIRWVAMQGAELIVMPDDCLRIDVSGDRSIAHASLNFEQDGEAYMELHDPVGSVGTIMRMRRTPMT